MKICSIDGCASPLYARGWCSRHYKQWRRHGRPLPDHAGQSGPCRIDSCDRPAEARSLCHGHYLRLRRTGDVHADIPLTPRERKTCAVDGCARAAQGRSLCSTHYSRWRTTGSAQEEEPVRRAEGNGAMSHGYWKVCVPEELRHLTNGATYVAEHRLVMARILARPLRPDESVHHVNGDRLDNSPANLELWSRWQPSGQRVADKVAWAIALLEAYAPHLLAH